MRAKRPNVSTFFDSTHKIDQKIGKNLKLVPSSRFFRVQAVHLTWHVIRFKGNTYLYAGCDLRFNI